MINAYLVFCFLCAIGGILMLVGRFMRTDREFAGAIQTCTDALHACDDADKLRRRFCDEFPGCKSNPTEACVAAIRNHTDYQEAADEQCDRLYSACTNDTSRLMAPSNPPATNNEL